MARYAPQANTQRAGIATSAAITFRAICQNKSLKRTLALLPLLVLAGCASAPEPKAETASLPEARVDPATAGTISGSIYFRGDAPSNPEIDMSSNPQCERQHKTPAHAETIVVNSNHTLRNVFVWIKSGLPQAHWAASATSARLDQNGCVYSPHVLGIMEGQDLEIINSDPVNHNVHAESQTNPAWNESEPPRAEHKFKRFSSEEVLFPVTCSVHPWMRAYVGVSPHPYFAVTGDDGMFHMKNVPPGTYTIEAVHEKLGRKEAKLTVPASGAATIEFIYGS